MPVPEEDLPTRGYGEDFWVEITERSGQFFKGIVDNLLSETPLHELQKGDIIVFHEDHILNVYDTQIEAILYAMEVADGRKFAEWLVSQLS